MIALRSLWIAKIVAVTFERVSTNFCEWNNVA